MGCDWHLTYTATSQKFSLRKGDVTFLKISPFTCHGDLKHARVVIKQAGRQRQHILFFSKHRPGRLPDAPKLPLNGQFTVLCYCVPHWIKYKC